MKKQNRLPSRITRRAGILLSIVALCVLVQGHAQPTAYSDNEYRKKPHWIAMMDDSTVNYYEVIKAYTLFWEGKEQPSEENDVLQEKRAEKQGPWKRLQHYFEERRKNRYEEYAFSCKKYQHWLIVNKPFVKEDGTIMTPEERIENWKKSRQ